MDVAIVVIGDEILLGQVTDTNSGFIARSLAPYAWTVKKIITVADNAEAIMSGIDQAFANADVVLTTGGLGPTADDITKPVLAKAFGSSAMRFDKEVFRNIQRIFESKHLPLNNLTRSQAMVPDNCKVIMNLAGTAPIMWFERNGGKQVLVSMPGVPSETESMFPKAVIPELLSHFSANTTVLHQTLILYGIGESHLAEKLASWENSLPEFLHLAYLPDNGIIRLRLDCTHSDADVARQTLANETDRLKELTSEWLVFDSDATPAQILLHELKLRKMTFATAESCTGGNIAHAVTLIPGSSESMLGGVVSYSNSVKTGTLGVSEHTLAQFGAVSPQVAGQMSEGVASLTGAHLTVATSGIAGPGGGTPEKPVGTVCHATTLNGKTISWTARYGGSRRQIIERATTASIVNAIIQLRKLYPL